MSKHSELAKELFKKGYNCSQSIVAAFSDETGLDEKTSLKVSSSFGGGMGRLREVCGAVSGMFMVAGLILGYSEPDDNKKKSEHYALVQKLAKVFSDQNGSIVCRDLLGLQKGSDSPKPEARTSEYYKKRPCIDLVGDAAEILDEYLESIKVAKENG